MMPNPPAPGWREVETEARYEATWKVARATGVVFLVGALFFLMVFGLWLNDAIASGKAHVGTIAAVSIFITLMVLWFGYLALATLLNTTKIVIDLKQVRQVNEPIPQIGGVRESLDQVTGITAELVKRPKGRDAYGVFVRTVERSTILIMFFEPNYAVAAAQRLDAVVKRFQAKAYGPYR